VPRLALATGQSRRQRGRDRRALLGREEPDFVMDDSLELAPGKAMATAKMAPPESPRERVSLLSHVTEHPLTAPAPTSATLIS
jgi:hypothetical protein